MRQSVLRYVSALLIAAAAATVLVGGASAQGPVPEQPSATSVVTLDITTVDIPIQATTVASAAGAAFGNSGIQMSSNIRCKRTTVTKTERSGPILVWELESWTEWCYDGTYIARGHPEFDHTWTVGGSPSPGSFLSNRGSGDKKLGGGLDDTYHKDKAWGKFQVCRQSNDKDPTSQPICFPVQTVEIIKTQYGDGDYEPKS